LLANTTTDCGSVTSVAASVPGFLSISGSPITTSGTLAISYSGTALPIANGGTNATGYNSHMVLAFDGTRFVATSTPTFAAIFATSTTATSTFAGAVGLASSTPWAALSIGKGGAVIVGENKIATSTTQVIDWNQGNQQLVQAGTGATTVSFINYLPGQTLRGVYCNPGTTAGAITWPNTTVLHWGGSVTPTQTTAANKCDTYSFIATQATSTNSSSALIIGAQSPY
jgi:hypothetical protein